jgi:hypothetical protein
LKGINLFGKKLSLILFVISNTMKTKYHIVNF